MNQIVRMHLLKIFPLGNIADKPKNCDTIYIEVGEPELWHLRVTLEEKKNVLYEHSPCRYLYSWCVEYPNKYPRWHFLLQFLNKIQCMVRII